MTAVPWRIHAILPRSRANGPGLRYVIWTQGCTLGCLGCFNPETHPAGHDIRPAGPVPAGTAEGMADAVLAAAERAAGGPWRLDGVTLTGGEPLEQPTALAAFAALLARRDPSLGIIVLTGFTRAEIERDPARSRAVADADMVIAGRYNQSLRLSRGLRGSANKEYWDRSGRYQAADFSEVPEVELVIGPDGALTVTGMPLDVVP